jgi:hypothetical protein
VGSHRNTGLVLGVLMLMSACASAPPFRPPDVAYEAALRERAVSEVDGDIRVSATIAGPEEARSIFGVDLGERDILPLWLEIANGSKERMFFLPTGLDPEYFAPLEVAFLYKGAVDHAALGRHLQAVQFDSRSAILPGETRAGFVFINAVDLSLVAQVDLVGWRFAKRIALSVRVPGSEAAQHRLAEMHARSGAADVVEIGDDAQLRDALEKLPCCTTDATGAGRGLPLNLALVGSLEEAGPAFVRRGYRQSAASPLHAVGRAQDLAVRKQTRWVAAQPNTLRFWMTPLRYRGKPVWLGQASATRGGRFADPGQDPQAIEPGVDDARNNVVQDLLYSQSVARLGFVTGLERVAPESPRRTPDGAAYHTDGLRAVLVFRNDTIPLSEIELFEWRALTPAVAGKAE